MKTSEAIREAVDKNLAATRADFHYSNGYKTKGLCIALREIPMAVPFISQFLDETGSIWLIGNNHESTDAEWHEAQCIRFMLAEFMALYFEDLGD